MSGSCDERNHRILGDMLSELRGSLICRRYLLGPIRLAMYVPSPDYPALLHLAEPSLFDDTADYELFFVEDGSIEKRWIESARAHSDTTFRAKRFASGFYLTNHYGPPATKITADERGKIHIVMGRDVYKTFWSYYVKYILTHFSAMHGQLHLKAGALVDQAGSVTLIVGKGSGGKSVLLNKLSKLGFTVLANTHVLVSDSEVWGVRSSVRVRADDAFRPIIEKHNLPPYPMEPGEYMCPPELAFAGASSSGRGRLKRILVTHYGDGKSGLASLDSQVGLTALKNLAYPLHTYGMKDDYLAFLGDDLWRFDSLYQNELDMLGALVQRYELLYCNLKDAEPGTFDRLLSKLVT
jgi:hypothetical protein